MRIGGLLPFSLIDYPGYLAAVLFTQGCPFRCDYCHNPQLVVPAQYGACIPESAVLRFLEQRVGQLDGVVMTGGEPTLHPDLADWITRIRGLGYRVKLDTTGLYPDVLRRLLDDGLLDYVAMDIKAPLENYRQVVHYPVSSTTIRQSIDLIMTSGIDYEFRTTVVRSQLSADDILQIGQLLSGARRYILQAFVPAQCINPAFRDKTSDTPAALARLADTLTAYVEQCSVR